MNTAPHPIRTRLHAWLQLLRPPNLFTVPGDPLAGLLLAHTHLGTVPDISNAVFPILAALLLYSAGLIGNDLADIRVDAQERPNRPLPSRRIRPRAAALACAALTALGLLCAFPVGPNAFLCAFLLTVLIFAYNFALKNVPVIGALTMGACRGVSLLLGATATAAPIAPSVWIAALMITLYITAVTQLAAREMRRERTGLQRWLPAAILLAGWIILFGSISLFPAATALGLLSCLWPLTTGYRLGPEMHPGRTPRLIGAFIRNLLLIQAAFCAVFTPFGWIAALLLIAAIPVSSACAAKFYAS